MATQQAAPPEYSVPFKQRRQRRLEHLAQRHLHFAEPVVTTVDDLVVCQAAFSEGEVCDSCYGVTGLLQVDGVTLDCSSSDETRALRNAVPQEVKREEELECDDHADDNSIGDLEDILSDDENDELDDSEDDQHDSHHTKNGPSLKETSSTSSCDGDSVIYMGHRNTFKGVDELVVTAEESLCLQAAESAKALELPVPQHASSYISFSPNKPNKSSPPESFVVETQIAPRSNSADSGVCSQQEGADRSSPCNSRFLAVVAIDIGTTNSGYAYSVCREPGRQVHIMRKGEGGDCGLMNQKTLTALLLTPTGAFHSFGAAAREFYLDLSPAEARRWQYFERFKMRLHHETELQRDMLVTASNGKSQTALVVFAHSLSHFKRLALSELRERCEQKSAPQESDIRWVVTVPAIWKQPARQLMREAAYQAGLCDAESADRLLIVLEPEAAAVQCREQLLQENPDLQRKNCLVANSLNSSDSSLDRHSNLSDESPSEGSLIRFLVADCGGGTVDITLHELTNSDLSLKELLSATGGPFGATEVDKEFESLLGALFGAEFMTQFKDKRPAAHSELLMSFEGRKRSVAPDREMPANLFPPYAFVDYFRKHSGKEVEYAIKKNGRRDISWCRDGVLRFQSSVMLQLFKNTVQKVVDHLREVLEDPILMELPAQYLFLVGGFSESEVLRKAVKEEFGSQLQVISPQPSSLATLRGAVLYGLDTTVISARKAKNSYGVGVLKKFIPGIHPASKLIISKDGQKWCADVLDFFVTAGQTLCPGHAETRRYVAAMSGQSAAVLNIYCATTAPSPGKPQYVTDEGVTRCGTLTLGLEDESDAIYADPHQLGISRIDPMNPHEERIDPVMNMAPSRRELNAHMFFSGTEIVVSATDTATGKCVKAEVDFLAGD